MIFSLNNVRLEEKIILILKLANFPIFKQTIPMRHFSNTILAAFILLMTSCDESIVYEEHTDPPGNLEWNRDDVLSFDIEIIDISIKYDQIIAFRHATGYAFSTCDIIIEETTPSGETNTYDFSTITADRNEYIGEVSGDIYDVEQIWRPAYIFPEKGTYHYEIRHNMTDDKIHMVMEVGMIVKKKDIE